MEADVGSSSMEYTATDLSVEPPQPPNDVMAAIMLNLNTSCVPLNAYLWEMRRDISTLWGVQCIFALLYTTIIFVGVTGNTCVLLAIARTKSLQTVPNMFIFSLSCSDIVVATISATVTPITAFQKTWIFGAALCHFAPFIAGVQLCFSTFTLTAIAVDRYVLIRFPTKRPLSQRRALMAIIFIYCTAVAFCLPTAITQSLDRPPHFCGLFCMENWGDHNQARMVYGAALLCVQYVLPIIVIGYCYTSISLRLDQSLILKSAKARSKQLLLVPQGTATSYEQLSDQERTAIRRRQRTNRMLIGMVVAFSASWVWSVTFNLLRDYERLPSALVQQEYFVGILTHCVAMTSTVWNPILYALLNVQLRAAFVRLLPSGLTRLLRIRDERDVSYLAPGQAGGGGPTHPTPAPPSTAQHLLNGKTKCGNALINGDSARTAKTVDEGDTTSGSVRRMKSKTTATATNANGQVPKRDDRNE